MREFFIGNLQGPPNHYTYRFILIRVNVLNHKCILLTGTQPCSRVFLTPIRIFFYQVSMINILKEPRHV